MDPILIHKIDLKVKDRRGEIKQKFDEFMKNRKGYGTGEISQSTKTKGNAGTNAVTLPSVKEDILNLHKAVDSQKGLQKDSVPFRKFTERITKLKLALDNIDVDASPGLLQGRRDAIKDLDEISELLNSALING